MPNSVPIFILLGGKSQRMGTDKALLQWGEQTLLRRTLEIATALSDEIYLLTPWRDRYQPYLSTTVHWLDDPAQQGGLVALHQGMKTLNLQGWVLLLACDLPKLDQGQLEQWIQQLDEIPTRYTAALVNQGQFYEPCCGFYRNTAQTSLQQFIDQGGRSFQKWLATVPVFPLAIANPAMLFNCNTPADFATLKTQPPSP
ncbi:molybdenum cofactor guanylyltransferase [Picosynechococcus sp. PCC 11901]|uniref:molybdenum cofactor guanylyltransferase n=1 Tax=Picosynechococcus sp. PCC 11901 TaxID=2579791 RepID=UPI0010FBF7DF|nr:molybdenum cofactor guanylyltransferase [Picosynechococcus sp. PCC 11901]QCS48648.1 molybdenum cofactor guanylyltransferase [Picosynechococcus sp. PCC 11901]